MVDLTGLNPGLAKIGFQVQIGNPVY
jgi:hypothetical protein